MCVCRAVAGPAHLPRGQWSGPAGRDHQGPGHAHQGPDTPDELQLHRVQVPSDKATPLEQGLCLHETFHMTVNFVRGFMDRNIQ